MSPCCFRQEGWICCMKNGTLCILGQTVSEWLEFDVELLSDILRPTVCSVLWNKVFSFTAIGSSYSAARRVKLGQMKSKFPKTSCILFLWLFWMILKFLDDSDNIWCLLEVALLIVVGCSFMCLLDIWKDMKWQSDIFGINTPLHTNYKENREEKTIYRSINTLRVELEIHRICACLFNWSL